MWKACSRCGKIHDTKYKCNKGKVYKDYKTKEDRLRSTRKWTNKSKQIREDSMWLCAVCKDEGRYNYNNLEVHHIEKLRHDINKLLDNDNLICLCSMHHKMADAGLLSKEYLIELVKSR